MPRMMVSCNLCGKTEFKLRYPGDALMEEPASGEQFSSSRTKVIRPRIVQCTGCGLVMANPQDSRTDLQAVYSHLADEEYHQEAHNRSQTARKRMNWINKTCPPGRLLDVGCATGIFLEEAGKFGWQLWGIEPSTWAVDQLRLRLPGAQVNVGFIESVTYPADAFELITLWDILEHVTEPALGLQTLHPWLVRGGYLFLNVPNIDSVSARLMGSRWVLFLREHLWYFSPTTITSLLEKTGYRVIEIRPNRVRFTLANVLNRIGQYPGLSESLAKRLAQASVLKRISLEFPIGEMSIKAVKV